MLTYPTFIRQRKLQRLRAMLLPVLAKRLKYSDDQPRDEQGQWTDGGGGGSGAPAPFTHGSGWNDREDRGLRSKTPEFGYHYTDIENLESIRATGLELSSPTIGSDEVVSLSDKLYPKSHEGAFENRDTDIVMFKVRIPSGASAYDDREVREYTGVGGEPNSKLGPNTAFFITVPVPPSNIWVVLPGSRRTVPLADYKRTPRKALKYSDDQPRGDDGKWTDGGGGGGIAGENDSGYSRLSAEEKARVLDEADAAWFDFEDASAMKEYIRTGTLDHWSSTGGDKLSAADQTKIKLMATALQDAASRERQPSINDVWRGAVVPPEEFSALAKGAIYKFESLTATSKVRDIASIYHDADNFMIDGGVPVMFRIGAMDGLRGYLRQHGDGAHNEFILPKGESFKVSQKPTQDAQGVWTVHLYQKKGSKAWLKYSEDQPRDEQGQWTDGGGGSGEAFGEIFSDAPIAGKDAAKWRKKMQAKYDTDPKFRAYADAVGLFTQGDYQSIRAIGAQQVTGQFEQQYAESVWPTKMDTPMYGAPGYEYKSFFVGQDFKQDSQATWKEGARAINEAIHTASPIDAPFYRGLNGYDVANVVTALKPGDSFDVAGPTSFTADMNLAQKWANGTASGQGGRISSGNVTIILEIESGARGVKVSALSPYKQSEIISSGKFEVVRVESGLDPTRSWEQHRVRLRQTDTWKQS